MEIGRMRKILPLNMQVGITVECWNYYRLALILTDRKYYPWYLWHLNQYYIDNNLQFTLDINNDMVSYYNDIIKTSEVNASNLINEIIRGIDEENYFMVYVDRYFMKEDVFYKKQRYLHEILIYGYDINEKYFIYIDINTQSGNYETSRISFYDLLIAFHAWYDEFDTESRQNRWVNNFLVVHGLYPVNRLELRHDTDQEIKLHLFAKDIRYILEGNAYTDKCTGDFLYSGIRVYDGYNEKLLEELEKNLHFLKEGNDISRGKSNFWILTHFKGMYECKKEFTCKLLYINKVTEKEIFEKELLDDIKRFYGFLKQTYELLCKFYFKADREILNRISLNLVKAKKEDNEILYKSYNRLIEFLKKDCASRYVGCREEST